MSVRTIGVAKRKANRTRTRERAREQTMKLVAKLCPAWITKGSSLRVSEHDLTRVLAKLDEEFETADQLRLARRVVSELLRRGAKDYGWFVPALPPPIIRIPRPSSPFEPFLFRNAHALSAIFAKHQRALEKPEPQHRLDASYRAGQILFSAIVSGALLCEPLIEQLPNQIAGRLNIHDDCFWFDFQLNQEAGHTRPAYRRWLPDPVTACLVLRWRLDGQTWPAEPAEELLVKYLKKLGVEFNFAQIAVKKVRPESASSSRGIWFSIDDPGSPLMPKRVRVQERTILGFLIAAAQTRAREWVPATLVDFAASIRAGTSLPPGAWWRTIIDKSLAPLTPPDSEDGAVKRDAVRVGSSEPEHQRLIEAMRGDDQWKLFGELRRCLQTKGKRLEPGKALRRLECFKEEHGTKLSHILQVLTAWAAWCIDDRTLGNGRIKVKSARRYLDAVGRGLMAVASELDLMTLLPEDFIALYDSALKAGARSYKQRGYMRDRLQELHTFMRIVYDVPAISWGDSDIDSQWSFPDANLVTEAEFGRLLHALQDAESERDKDLRTLIAVLGFRLGLRRDEIAGLQFDSIQGVLSPETGEMVLRPLLWVHVTEWSDIKRNSSARRLPLALLLSRDELVLLRRWLARRFRECSGRFGPTAPLVTTTAGTMEKIGDGPFRVVTEAIHKIAGDLGLRFHHLRHSFITLLNARTLAVADPADRYDLPSSWKSEAENLNSATLLKALFRFEQAPRHAIYQTAALAGHLDPQETLQSYNHGFDWLLERYMSRAEIPITLGLLATLQGLSYSAAGVERLRKRSRGELAAKPPLRQFGLTDLISVRTELLSLVKEKGWVVQPPAHREYVHAKLPWIKHDSGLLKLRLDDVYALALSGTKPLTEARRASLFELTPEEATRFLAAAARRASAISAMHDERRRSPKYLAGRNSTMTTLNTRKRPEIAGIGPSLPTVRSELREARYVFDQLRQEFIIDHLQTMEALTAFITCSNRNNAELTSSNDHILEAVAALTKLAGIERHRIRLEILSWPKCDDVGDIIINRLANLFDITAQAVRYRENANTTKQRCTYGRISVWVLEPSSRVHAHLATERRPRAGFGWKVACYYAICIIDACMAA